MVPRQRQPPTTTITVEGPPSSAGQEKRPLVVPDDSTPDQQQIADIARHHHDVFNLIALPLINITSAMNWNWIKLLHGFGPTVAWTGHFFNLNWGITYLYFVVDVCWVAIIPISVKTPDVIIKHHLATLVYLFGPILWPDFRWVMGACLSVEINTWFLILRRVLFKSEERINPVILELVSICFYVSWVVIRCGIYPAVMYEFCRRWLEELNATGKWWHLPMVCMPVHLFLCVLNIKWTYDLFSPMIKKRMGKDVDVTISSGL